MSEKATTRSAISAERAMKLALEALEGADWYINQLEMIVYSADDAGTHENRLKVQQAITALREALAKQPAQQEPEYIQLRHKKENGFSPWGQPLDPNYRHDKWAAGVEMRLLYTSPPTLSLAQRTWQGLTNEDMYEFAAAQYCWEDLLFAIEAKLKEKNT